MRYIGSKRFLAGSILQAVQNYGVVAGVFADLFAGTGAVGRVFKAAGYEVIAADLLTFSYILQGAYIQLASYPTFTGLDNILRADGEWADVATSGQRALFEALQNDGDSLVYRGVLNYLNSLPGTEGYVYRHYTEEGSRVDGFERRYYTAQNAKKIDAIRSKIQQWHDYGFITNDEYGLLLATLLESMPAVANVLGTYGAYKKGEWEPRACKTLKLTPLAVTDNGHDNQAICGDANTLIRHIESDILYLDPPYNARQYGLYYHLLETVAVGDEPEVTGVTGKPVMPRPLSRYCNTVSARDQLRDLVAHARCQHIFLSYSSEGLIEEKDIHEIFSLRGDPSPVMVIAQHRRYRSDQDRLAIAGGRARNYAENTTVDEKLFHVTVVRDAPPSEKNMQNEGNTV